MMMRFSLIPALSTLLVFGFVSPSLDAQSASAVDKTFVDSVSQGGAFEVQASQVAEKKASGQDVKDLASMEVHDHQLVSDKLKSIASSAKIDIASQLNPDFQGKLDALAKLNGAAFDASYLSQMKQIHDKDEKLFAQEATAGASADFRKFAAETDKIVKRHIGALHGLDKK